MHDPELYILNNVLEDFHFEPMLNGLTPKLYQLVHLHYLEGFSMTEISELLAIPAATVKSRQHQVKKHIKSDLQNRQI